MWHSVTCGCNRLTLLYYLYYNYSKKKVRETVKMYVKKSTGKKNGKKGRDPHPSTSVCACAHLVLRVTSFPVKAPEERAGTPTSGGTYAPFHPLRGNVTSGIPFGHAQPVQNVPVRHAHAITSVTSGSGHGRFRSGHHPVMWLTSLPIRDAFGDVTFGAHAHPTTSGSSTTTHHHHKYDLKASCILLGVHYYCSRVIQVQLVNIILTTYPEMGCTTIDLG